VICIITDPRGERIRELPYKHVDWKLKT
jgi:hypothetical protein